MTNHNMRIFEGKPLFQATKQHLNNSLNGKKKKTNKKTVGDLSAFGWDVLLYCFGVQLQTTLLPDTEHQNSITKHLGQKQINILHLIFHIA